MCAEYLNSPLFSVGFSATAVIALYNYNYSKQSCHYLVSSSSLYILSAINILWSTAVVTVSGKFSWDSHICSYIRIGLRKLIVVSVHPCNQQLFSHIAQKYKLPKCRVPTFHCKVITLKVLKPMKLYSFTISKKP